MKKIRLMLVAIAVLGVAGGAAAFKAKRFGSSTYCTTTIDGDFCDSFVTSARFVAGQGTKYVITTRATACTMANLDCTGIGIKVN